MLPNCPVSRTLKDAELGVSGRTEVITLLCFSEFSLCSKAGVRVGERLLDRGDLPTEEGQW